MSASTTATKMIYHISIRRLDGETELFRFPYPTQKTTVEQELRLRVENLRPFLQATQMALWDSMLFILQISSGRSYALAPSLIGKRDEFGLLVGDGEVIHLTQVPRNDPEITTSVHPDSLFSILSLLTASVHGLGPGLLETPVPFGSIIDQEPSRLLYPPTAGAPGSDSIPAFVQPGEEGGVGPFGSLIDLADHLARESSRVGGEGEMAGSSDYGRSMVYKHLYIQGREDDHSPAGGSLLPPIGWERRAGATWKPDNSSRQSSASP